MLFEPLFQILRRAESRKTPYNTAKIAIAAKAIAIGELYKEEIRVRILAPMPICARFSTRA